jgi:hypothetical protein
MILVKDVYLLSRDVKVLQRRLDWLTHRLTTMPENYGGCGFDKGEQQTLQRVLSQVSEKGERCDKPGSDNPDAFDATELRAAGWRIRYMGSSQPKPWTAARGVETIEAATFAELKELALPTVTV